MRGANRNKQKFWYALYAGREPTYDEYGNENGWSVLYGKPEMTSGNISPCNGEAARMMFGIDTLYDRIIGPMPVDTPIDEYAVLWIGTTPELNADGSIARDEGGHPVTPWNFIVTKVARSLPVFGGTMLAVDEVAVT